MSTATITARPVSNATAASQQKPSIWRRMFDAWVRSYEDRISPDGKVYYGGL